MPPAQDWPPAAARCSRRSLHHCQIFWQLGLTWCHGFQVVVGQSGQSKQGQPSIDMTCPGGLIIASGAINGSCCSTECPVGGFHCSCNECTEKRGFTSNWSSSMVCTPPTGLDVGAWKTTQLEQAPAYSGGVRAFHLILFQSI